jgi:hypothetical protein
LYNSSKNITLFASRADKKADSARTGKKANWQSVCQTLCTGPAEKEKLDGNY